PQICPLDLPQDLVEEFRKSCRGKRSLAARHVTRVCFIVTGELHGRLVSADRRRVGILLREFKALLGPGVRIEIPGLRIVRCNAGYSIVGGVIDCAEDRRIAAERSVPIRMQRNRFSRRWYDVLFIAAPVAVRTGDMGSVARNRMKRLM